MYMKLWKSRNYMIADLTITTILAVVFIVITVIDERKNKF